MGKQWKQWETSFLGSKITADDNCSHEIKRCLLLGRKAMTNLDGVWKSRDITLPTKVHLIKARVFPVVIYGYECSIVMKVECWRTDAFELWRWRRHLRVPWTARKSNKSILKEIKPVNPSGNQLCTFIGRCCSSNSLAAWCKELTLRKRLRCWERKGRKRRGWQSMRWLDDIPNSMDMSWANSGRCEGQGSLVCCSPWRSQRVACYLATEQQHHISISFHKCFGIYRI